MKNTLTPTIRIVLLLAAMATLQACDIGTVRQDPSSLHPIKSTPPSTPSAVGAAATVEAYKDLAGKYVGSGNYPLAFENYNKAIKLSPGDSDAYLLRGFAHLYVEEYPQALADFDRASELGYPYKGYVAYSRGLAYLWEGAPDKAIDECSKAIVLQPGEMPGYQCRGQANIAKGNYDEAIGDLTRAAEINPRSAAPYADRGLAYGHKGTYDLAFADFDRAFGLEKDSPYTYLRRGQVYELMGEKEKARSDFHQALESSNDVYIQHVGKQQLAAIGGQ